jgi:hypothetical protein
MVNPAAVSADLVVGGLRNIVIGAFRRAGPANIADARTLHR